MTQQEKMFSIIEEWERSGQTKAAFARESGISIQTFHYWFRRYQQRQPIKSPPAFIELPTVALTQSGSTPDSSREPRLRLEFVGIRPSNPIFPWMM